jgi:hypothetical protein
MSLFFDQAVEALEYEDERRRKRDEEEGGERGDIRLGCMRGFSHYQRSQADLGTKKAASSCSPLQQ